MDVKAVVKCMFDKMLTNNKYIRHLDRFYLTESIKQYFLTCANSPDASFYFLFDKWYDSGSVFYAETLRNGVVCNVTSEKENKIVSCLQLRYYCLSFDYCTHWYKYLNYCCFFSFSQLKTVTTIFCCCSFEIPQQMFLFLLILYFLY